jgi:fatty acid desaturase
MPSTTNRDIKEMLLGLELTLVGGLLATWGLLWPFMPLVLAGVPLALFGFWVSVDTYANGVDPRTTTETRTDRGRNDALPPH